jgi:hypothetical protein
MTEGIIHTLRAKRSGDSESIPPALAWLAGLLFDVVVVLAFHVPRYTFID